VLHQHIDAHCSKEQKHNRNAADPHNTHFAFFSVGVILVVIALSGAGQHLLDVLQIVTERGSRCAPEFGQYF
jgi:hypothetical protein